MRMILAYSKAELFCSTLFFMVKSWTPMKKEQSTDSIELLNCCRCNSKMKKISAFKSKKEGMKGGVSDFWIDRCMQCKCIWLDGGELSKIQLDYQMSKKGKGRKKNLNPEVKNIKILKQLLKEKPLSEIEPAAEESNLEPYFEKDRKCEVCEFHFRTKGSEIKVCKICKCKMEVNQHCDLTVISQPIVDEINKLLLKFNLFALCVFVLAGLLDFHYGYSHLYYYLFISISVIAYLFTSKKGGYIFSFNEPYAYKGHGDSFMKYALFYGFFPAVTLCHVAAVILEIVMPFFILDYILPIIEILLMILSEG